MKLNLNSNVYILGAGFSVAAGMPVIRNFLNCMRLSIPWLEQTGRAKELDAVGRVLEFRLHSAAAAERMPLDLENVEELFSLASAVAPHTYADSIIAAICATIDHVDSLPRRHEHRRPLRYHPSAMHPARDFPPDWKMEPSAAQFRDPDGAVMRSAISGRIGSYDELVCMMLGLFCGLDAGTHNTIITFNYDLILERVLERLGVPYDYRVGPDAGFRPKSAWPNCTTSVSVLKLHGSVNWARLGDDDGGVAVHRSYSDVLKAGVLPHIVPPTWRKQADSGLTAVWDHAVAALTDATRVFVVGYSMPSTDPHFRYLVASGLSRNASLRSIVVINPDAKATEHSLSLLFRPELRERGVLHVANKSCHDFFKDPYAHELAGRTVSSPFYI